MKKLTAAIVTALLLAAPLAQARAPAAIDPKTVVAVRDMLETMKYREMIVEMNQQMAAQLPQMLMTHASQAIKADAKLTDKDREEALALVNAKMPEIVAAVRDVMEDPKLIDEMINAMPALYARHFTLDEIVEMGRFYKTPLGAKTLKVMPQLMAESMQLGQQLVAPRIEAMGQRIMQSMGVKPGQ